MPHGANKSAPCLSRNGLSQNGCAEETSKNTEEQVNSGGSERKVSQFDDSQCDMQEDDKYGTLMELEDEYRKGKERWEILKDVGGTSKEEMSTRRVTSQSPDVL